VKRKATIYVDEEVLRSAKVFAARTGRSDSDVVEEALRSYLGFDVLEQVWATNDLTEEEANRIANEAVHEVRRERA
jgi:hypothetical protein